MFPLARPAFNFRRQLKEEVGRGFSNQVAASEMEMYKVTLSYNALNFPHDPTIRGHSHLE